MRGELDRAADTHRHDPERVFIEERFGLRTDDEEPDAEPDEQPPTTGIDQGPRGLVAGPGTPPPTANDWLRDQLEDAVDRHMSRRSPPVRFG